jgi:hypothetical protein
MNACRSLSPTLARGLALLAMGINAPTLTSAAPVLIGTYYEDVGNCFVNPAIDSCTATFSRIPAGKDLFISRVSCEINLAVGAVIYYADLAAKTNSGTYIGSREEYLVFVHTATEAGTNTYSINDAVSFVVRGTQFPAIRVNVTGTAGSFAMYCHLSGQLVKQP